MTVGTGGAVGTARQGPQLVLLTLAAGQFLMTLDSSVMNVLYFEAPDAAVAGTAETFSLEELYEGRDTQSIDVLDSTGVHHLR